MLPFSTSNLKLTYWRNKKIKLSLCSTILRSNCSRSKGSTTINSKNWKLIMMLKRISSTRKLIILRRIWVIYENTTKLKKILLRIRRKLLRIVIEISKDFQMRNKKDFWSSKINSIKMKLSISLKTSLYNCKRMKNFKRKLKLWNWILSFIKKLKMIW